MINRQQLLHSKALRRKLIPQLIFHLIILEESHKNKIILLFLKNPLKEVALKSFLGGLTL